MRVEARSREPLVPFAALRNRTMVAADLAAFLLFGAFFSFIFLASLLMQQLLLYSPTRTGVAWLATSITAFLAAGHRWRPVGVRGSASERLLIIGMSLAALGLALLTQVSPGANYVNDLLPALAPDGRRHRAQRTKRSDRSPDRSSRAHRRPGIRARRDDARGRRSGRHRRRIDRARLQDPRRRARSPTLQREQSAIADGFQSAFTVTLVLAVLGVLVAAIAFPRRRADAPPDPGSGADSVPQVAPKSLQKPSGEGRVTSPAWTSR